MLIGDCNNREDDDYKTDLGVIVHDEPQFVEAWEVPYFVKGMCKGMTFASFNLPGTNFRCASNHNIDS